MLDYFGKENNIKSRHKRLCRLAEVALNRFHTVYTFRGDAST
jgi:hypothetical protein